MNENRSTLAEFCTTVSLIRPLKSSRTALVLLEILGPYKRFVPQILDLSTNLLLKNS